MPSSWLPGLLHHPGNSAGYSYGRNRMTWCKHHDTAGTDSYNICRNGRAGQGASLCQILLPKVGVPWQFAEIDALCWDSGVWNQWGPGIEVERFHDEELTPDQVFWLGEINAQLVEHGIPNIQYRGSQFGAQGFVGHVNHSDIAYNPDGLTYAEWDQIMSVEPAPAPEDDTVKPILFMHNNAVFVEYPRDGDRRMVARVLSAEEWNGGDHSYKDAAFHGQVVCAEGGQPFHKPNWPTGVLALESDGVTPISPF